jgi:hypothetical protein
MDTTISDTTNKADEVGGREIGASGTPRYTRRLSDKVLIAFHHACDQSDFEVAEQLLHMSGFGICAILTQRTSSAKGRARFHREGLHQPPP